METQDEADYRALSKDPKTTASDLIAFAHSKGFAVTPKDAQAFIRKRATKGVLVGDKIIYKSAGGLPPAPPSAIKIADKSPSFGRSAAATGATFIDGALPDVSRALVGAGGALGNTTRSALGMEDFNPSLYYQSASNDIRDSKAELERDHPIVSGTAGYAGFGAGFLAPELKVIKAAKGAVPAAVITKAAIRRATLAKVANSSATSAAYGTVAGGLQGEGTDRIRNALEGGVAGGVMGAVAIPAVSGLIGGAKRVGRVAAPYIAPRLAEAITTRNAQRNVMGALDGHFTPAEAAAEIERRSQAGVPAMPADLTDQTRQLAGHSSRGLGPGQSAVREAVAERQRNAVPRMQEQVSNILGDTVDPYAQVQALTDKARADAKPFYDKAYLNPITVTPSIREFMDSPQGGDAIRAGLGEIQNTPSAARNLGSETPTKTGFQWDPELGAYTEGQVPVAEAFDNAGQHLSNLISDKDNRFVQNAGETTSNRPALLQKTQLDEDLYAQNPALRTAREKYAGPAADRAAFQTGRQEIPGSSRTTVPDAIHQMRNMTDSQKAQYQLGDRTLLSDKIAGQKINADATSPINSNDQRGALIRQIHGPEAADRLNAVTAMEKDAHLTYKEVFGNAMTANRQAVDNGMSEEALLHSGAHLARGNFLSAAGSFLSGVMTGRLGKHHEGLKAEMGRILTEANPSNVAEAMRAIQARADKDQSFKDSIARFSVTTSKGLTPSLVGHSGDRSGMYPDDPQ